MPTIDLEEARSIASAKEKQYGLPEGTIYKMAGMESSFNGAAVSPKGARGYLQFMEPTAKTYGVTVGDFESEADGAARYMRDNLKKYQGNMDLSLADYNGGPKAAAALAKGKPYAETSGYLSKFYGGKASSLSTQFTTGQEAVPNLGGPSASDLYQQSKQQQSQYGGFWNGVSNLPSAVATGFKVDNSVYNWWQERGLSQVDPNFKWSDDISKPLLEGVPEKHWDYILQSTSMQEAQARRSRMVDTMEKEAELSRMGVAGFGGRLVGGLADLPTLIAFVPGMGGEGLLTAGSRIANAARLGIVGAATNVAFDAAAMKYRPTATADDLYISAAMGLGLGAVVGGAINPKRLTGHLDVENKALADYGRAESVAAQRAELVSHTAGNAESIAKMDAVMPSGRNGVPEVAIDRKIAAGQVANAEVDPVVARIRDEIPTYEMGNIATRRTVKGLGDQQASEVLATLNRSSDELVAALASRLEGQLGDDIRVVTRSDGVRSFYDPVKHEIHLRADAPDSVKIHEIAHAVTANKIRYGLDNPTSAHGELVSQLQDVFNQVTAASKSETFTDAKTSYYLKNMDEFVAGMYSGKSEFIDFMAKTKLEGGHTLLSKAVDIVRKILGMDPTETNALTQALGITDKLVDTPLDVKTTVVDRKAGTTKKLAYRMEPAEGAPVDVDTVHAANTAEIPTVFGWGLGLENKLGGAKAPPEVRDLASKLFGTTIGYKDHSVVKANAWEDTTKWADSWAVEMRKGTYPQFEDWMKQSGKPWHQKGQAFDEFGTMVSNYVRGIDADYPPQVVKAGDQMRKTLNNVREYINNPLRDEGGVKRGLTEVEVRDAEGSTKMVGKLDKNDQYLPRKHDVNKWNDMTTSFGRSAVEGWWARAYQAGREGVSDEAAEKFAKWYVRTVEEAHANRTQDLLGDIMQGTDKDALRNSLMQNGGFDSFQAQKVIDDMFPTEAKGQSDAGRSSSLKHRNTIDETYSETWTRADGEKVQVGLNDFIHANAFEVVEPYLRRTAGNVALAKHLDIYKAGQIDSMIADATGNKLGAEFKKSNEIASMRKDLKFAFDRIQANPQEEFTALNKSLGMWRNFNVIRLMGGAVWNQANEMSQIIGSMGWKTTLAAVPELKALSRDIATGKAPHDILDHLENTIGGVGSEYVARLDFKASDDWVRYKGDTKFNRTLDAIDTGTKKMAKGVLDYTGMTPLMVQQKRVHAVALVNHFVNTANGTPSNFLSKDRLAWMGMSEGDYGRVLENIKEFTKPTKGEYGQTYKMDFAGWTKADPESYSKFMTAIHRETRRVIQENDLASMIPLMGSTLGKTVFQFMNFSMHGWNKSLNFAMNHRDWSTLSTVMHGGLFASLSYMGRTMLDSVGMDAEKRQDFLDKRMAPNQIVANSFGRVSQASLLPNIYDTVSPFPLFSGMRTTSDLSSLASNPTYQAINGLISMKKLVRNSLSDEYQTTEKDIRTWGKLLPLNNVVPVSTFLNALANDYPRNEKEQ